ncbi:helix-turn-helix domain-containing protein [Nitrobacter vulgaris]|uniref:helix-turn-helix domain-containing protein n=1 Tax=Nitrobacter vulgaris TaxID=29421 RepID=UPI00286A1835|nr:helix-turn-helix domain-containing protein [Nitrobacter vulgaris]
MSLPPPAPPPRRLAKAANLSTAALNSIERGRAIPRPATAASIQRALEDAGAQFIPENGGGAGTYRFGCSARRAMAGAGK